MGSFFYWLYAVGYKLLHRNKKANFQGNEDKEFRHIYLEYPVFWAENCGRLPVEYPEIAMAVLVAFTVRLNFAT